MMTVMDMTEDELVKDFDVRDLQAGEGLEDSRQNLARVSEDDHRLTLRTPSVKLIHPKLASKFVGLLFPLFEVVFSPTLNEDI